MLTEKSLVNLLFKYFLEDFYSNLVKVSWWSAIWHKSYVLRHVVFAWLSLVSGLKTTDMILKHNIIIPQHCFFCFTDHEMANHLFFECSYTFNILVEIFPWTCSFLLRSTILLLFSTVQVMKRFFLALH